MPRLKDQYKAEIAPALMKKFSYKSVMQIPKLDKIVINVGAGEAKENSKVIDSVMTDIWQSPVSIRQSARLRRALQTSSCVLACPSA